MGNENIWVPMVGSSGTFTIDTNSTGCIAYDATCSELVVSVPSDYHNDITPQSFLNQLRQEIDDWHGNILER